MNMLRRFSTRRIIGFFLLDWLGTLAVLFVSTGLRAEWKSPPPILSSLIQALGIPSWTGEIGNWEVMIVPQVFVLVAIIWPVFFIIFLVYDGRRNESLTMELLNVFLAICVSTMALAGLLYFTYRDTSRLLFLIFFFLDTLLLLGSRAALAAFRSVTGSRRSALRRAAIVIGAGPVGRNTVEQLKKYADADINVVGFVDDDPAKRNQSFDGLSVLGTLDHLPALVAERHIQNAVVALPLHAHERMLGICRNLQELGVRVYVIPDLFALSFPNAALDGFGGIPVIDLGQPGLHGWRRVTKRVFDVLAVSLGLLIISPVMCVVAALIKLESPGPILYRQPRVGENGRLFTMFKFRSMRADADPELHKAHVTRLIKQNLNPDQIETTGTLKIGNDPRITRVGKIIRKTSIDELPQAFNVLRGDMSLVGPRPPIPYEVELYQDWHKRRFEAIPGITGLWQVAGRNRVSFDEMVRMDIEYIEHQSLLLDVQILIKTPFAVVTGKGAG
jgi:exopolysaccharide biosynthesis polyprenyl glycosylphosphotransferase